MRKRERLARARDIANTRKTGTRRKDENFSVTISKRPTGDTSRATVVVSKQTARKAVDRNHVKRQVREIIKPHIGKTSGPFVDVVISVKKPALAKSYSALKVSLLALLD
ncbi:MAG: ribonuclease P protein component [bacterium]|nr:ribonuclease P protein component [bacterium]